MHVGSADAAAANWKVYELLSVFLNRMPRDLRSRSKFNAQRLTFSAETNAPKRGRS
jgi:hypothetical protein